MSLLQPLLALLPLDRLPRTGWVIHGVPEAESISDHILSTCHLVLALGPRINPPLDTERALALAVVHDAPEALTGDLPRGARKRLPGEARRELDRSAGAALLAPISPLALDRHGEYLAGQSREARLVKLCDKLQLGLRLVAYRRAGIGGLGEFREGLAALDTGEFPPAEDLRREIMAALDELDGAPAGAPGPAPGDVEDSP
ncbi:MAG TPA: HD domain-containing protein [Planctomycetota bacterium]|nr:HD domain-containing protein [Planctomycetota bacterium]